MDLIDRLRLDVPILQAGMGGGVSGPRLAGAVAAAGGLGTLGLTSPQRLRAGIASVRAQAPGRAVAVNLLMPFVRKRHIATCRAERIDVAILFFGGSPALVAALHDAGTFVMAQVGTMQEATAALAWGVDSLIAQGIEAGGHLLGREPGLAFLASVLPIARGRPVLLAGGMATADDTRTALAAGAAGIVAGTRFMLTPESDAHPLYQQRVLAANATLETSLFGFGWPARHRVVANAATARWCRGDGSMRSLPAFLNRASAPIGHVVNDALIARLPTLQRAWLPLLAATPPLRGMPATVVDSTPLYAGESALRMATIIPAKAAVDLLAGRPG
jgi:NAD(P)H-dependent flavin oxidoreductase YrpB (nitropropane dioxygenase family)